MLISPILSLLLLSSSPIQLGTNVPVTSPNNASRQVHCILQQLRMPYQLQTLPWLRARQEVRMQRLDGYFTAILLAEMQHYGELSAPMFLENWYWFTHPDSIGKSDDTIVYGVIRGSHQANWYEFTGIKPAVEVNTLSELMQVLQRQRIDKVLLDLEDFAFAAEQLAIDARSYRRDFFRYVPLGLFVSYQFLQQHPEFLSQFNQHIHTCAQAPFALSPIEQEQILQLLLTPIKQLASSTAVIEGVLASNTKPMPPTQLHAKDQQWIDEVEQMEPQLGRRMLQQPLSQFLQQWQQQQAGLVNEIIVTDQQGKNVAISAITSDYWQGNEAKFLNVFQQDKDYFLDAVVFDASTQRFQVQLSLAIVDEAGQHSGVLTVGIDVEQALRRNNY
ncbi:cellulose-binding family II protein [Alkalimonas collagenimarina]|uniref:Cellulose-binding family II protein n=1 Tax=Alkalimonas collagenimarina TaxID=400390 RepID=A0ABT9GYJ3_9GAMM|nr:cellulose-binding family II protein [Alkalimonas collagenimarina]MDP4536132.1 cellulose-binding family II protein [Alkalimonas collagenimarina]